MPGFELPVQGGFSAPGVRMVDDVVVDERGGVEEFERACGLGESGAQPLPVEVLTDGELVTPPQQDRADPLPAARVVEQRSADLACVGGDGGELIGLLRQERFDLRGHLGDDGFRIVEAGDRARRPGAERVRDVGSGH